MFGRRKWNIRASNNMNRIKSPIEVAKNIRMEPNPEKELINFSFGDTTAYGHLNPPQVAIDAINEAVNSMKCNGYAALIGDKKAREAIAKYSSTEIKSYTAEDIIFTNGCSEALQLCIACLSNPGQNILIPIPGYGIYKTIADSLGINFKCYNLKPESGWTADLDQIKKQIDDDTVAIIINNPSNPCGSVFSRQHLNDILEIARNSYLPIIADEVYEYLVFEGQTFIPLAELSNDVPILTCSSLSKRLLVPGWRAGWIKIHDPKRELEKEIKPALIASGYTGLGCNMIVQGALPKILAETPESFYKEIISLTQRHACSTYEKLVAIKGLTPIKPSGTIYMMVAIDFSHFPAFQGEIKFIEQLVKEESLFFLPGVCFHYPLDTLGLGYIRFILTMPEHLLREACKRLEDFCKRHYVENISEYV